jgi:hypothetical protein
MGAQSRNHLYERRVFRLCEPACAPIRAGEQIFVEGDLCLVTLPITQVINDRLAIVGASEPDDWRDRADFLPL